MGFQRNKKTSKDATEHPVTCPDCGAPMRLRESKHGYFYGCSNFPRCKTAHGAHPDGKPLGVPADHATRQMRIKAHRAFDEIWRDHQLLTRGAAYRWLSKRMGVEAHMGAMNIEQCEHVINLCSTFDPSDPVAVEATQRELERKAAHKTARNRRRRRRQKKSSPPMQDMTPDRI